MAVANLWGGVLTGEAIDSLEDRMIVIENPRMTHPADFPVRSDTSISIIVLGGRMECAVDLTRHRIDEPGMLIILPSQIVETVSFSDDFRGYCLMMSSAFLDNMPFGNQIPLLNNVRQRGFYPMDGQSLAAVENYVRMVQGAIRAPSNYRHEIVTHLTIAYYYGLGTYIHEVERKETAVSRYGQISDEFLELVRTHCHLRRDVGFYADALCLSAKHVNLAVKQVTGDNAMKWIERYTILKAKSLLKTTTLSVGEIADRLNFPTAADFGKYFKRFTGYSPRAFRNA